MQERGPAAGGDARAVGALMLDAMQLRALVMERSTSEPYRSAIFEAIDRGAGEDQVREMLASAVEAGHAFKRRFVSDRSRSIPHSPLNRA